LEAGRAGRGGYGAPSVIQGSEMAGHKGAGGGRGCLRRGGVLPPMFPFGKKQTTFVGDLNFQLRGNFSGGGGEGKERFRGAKTRGKDNWGQAEQKKQKNRPNGGRGAAGENGGGRGKGLGRGIEGGGPAGQGKHWELGEIMGFVRPGRAVGHHTDFPGRAWKKKAVLAARGLGAKKGGGFGGPVENGGKGWGVAGIFSRGPGGAQAHRLKPRPP